MHHRSEAVSEDALIAAIASTQGLTVVTRDMTDFRLFAVRTFNPFKFAG